MRGAVGVAGTYTTLVANKLGMTEYDGRARPGPRAHARPDRRRGRPLRRAHQRGRGRLPGIQPGREDVILAGALIAREACARVRPRRRARQRGRPARGRGARARRRLARAALTGSTDPSASSGKPCRLAPQRPEFRSG